RLSHAERVCGSTAKRSVPSCNGPGRCGVWAFAPWPVAQPALQGAHTGGKGRRLKLAVVRRIWAGHATMRDLRCPRIRQVEYGGQGSWGRLLVNCIGAQSAALADETKHDGSSLEDGVRLSVGDHAIPRPPPLECSGYRNTFGGYRKALS